MANRQRRGAFSASLEISIHDVWVFLRFEHVSLVRFEQRFQRVRLWRIRKAVEWQTPIFSAVESNDARESVSLKYNDSRFMGWWELEVNCLEFTP